MQVDKEDNVWFTMTVPERSSHFGFPTKFNPQTEELTIVPLPEDGSARFGDGSAQFLDLASDGRLWMNSGVDFYRVDPETMMADRHFDATPTDSPATRHFVYQMVVDSKGTPYGTDFPASHIVRVDADTGKVSYWPTLTPNALPRRAGWTRRTGFGSRSTSGTRSVCSIPAQNRCMNFLCPGSTRHRTLPRPQTRTGTCMRRAT